MRKSYFVLCVSFLHVNAQQTQRLRDSINKYQFLNPNRAIEFGMEYVELQLQTTHTEMVKTYSKIGEILLYMELYSSALEYFNTALRINRVVKDPNMANLYNLKKPPWIVVNIGNIYFQNSNFKRL